MIQLRKIYKNRIDRDKAEKFFNKQGGIFAMFTNKSNLSPELADTSCQYVEWFSVDGYDSLGKVCESLKNNIPLMYRNNMELAFFKG